MSIRRISLTLCFAITLIFGVVGCGGSPTSPTSPPKPSFQVEIYVGMYQAPLRYMLGSRIPLAGVRIETIGGPTPGVLAVATLGWEGRYTLELPVNYDGQMVRLSLEGLQSYEARLGGNAEHRYHFPMNSAPHVLTGYLFSGTAGVEVEILDGVNAGRKTVAYAYADQAAYLFEGLLTSPPFRLRVGTRVYVFEGQSHAPSSDILRSFVPVSGLYHHAQFSPQ